MEQPYVFRDLGRRTHLPALCKETRPVCNVVQFQRSGRDLVSGGKGEMRGSKVRRTIAPDYTIVNIDIRL
jgi:hypothetical protein